MPSDPAAPDAYSALFSHLSSLGATGLDRVRVEDRGPPRGRGLFAAAPIPGGSRVLSVPLHACVRVELAGDVLGQDVVEKFDALRGPGATSGAFAGLGEADGAALLALLLVRARGELLDGESHLADDSADAGEQDSRSRARALLRHYLPTLPPEVQGGFPTSPPARALTASLAARLLPLLPPSPSHTPDRFLWAYSCVLSRSMTFALPDGSQLLLMVPAADMANHHPSPADARYHLYATEEREVSLYARWELEPGEEVTINYGRGVGEGTLHYGFVVR